MEPVWVEEILVLSLINYDFIWILQLEIRWLDTLLIDLKKNWIWQILWKENKLFKF